MAPISDRTRSTIFDVFVTVGVLLLAGLTWSRPLAMAVAPAMAVALLWRRRFPLSVMTTVSALALLQVLMTGRPYADPMPFDLAVLIAMYSVVKYGTSIRHAYFAAAVVITGIVIEVVRHSDSRWWMQTLFYLAVCGGVWLSGFVVRTRRAYVASLEEKAATLEREREHLATIAVAHERAAIAREMHDVVAHSLAVIIVQSDGGRYAMARDPDKGRQTLETVAATAREALEEMRRLIDLLRSGTEDEESDADRVVSGLGRIEALVDRARDTGIDATLTMAPVPVADNSTTSVAIYRLVQEALTNVLRHAGPAARCAVTIGVDGGQIRVSVVDDGGRQPRPESEPDRVGHGLAGMRERVTVLGGELLVGPNPQGRWAVCARLPLPLPLPVSVPVPASGRDEPAEAARP